MAVNSFNRVRISRTALKHNYNTIVKAVGPARPVMAMVKADAYGHGMVESSRAFAEAGCRYFGVAELVEGVRLRTAGLAGDIYVTLGFPKNSAGLLLDHRLTPVIYSVEQARALSLAAIRRGQGVVGVHLKIDTGMGRLGILPKDVPGFLSQLAGVDRIEVRGVMSHFPMADVPQASNTMEAMARFDDVCRELRNGSHLIRHIANSGGVINFPATHCDMVRAGIALYGYDPAGIPLPAGISSQLRPALSCVTRILQVKTLPAGSGISYGHTYITPRPMTIGVIPMGYEDGFDRALSNKGEVLVHGNRAPVVGRVCMNMTMIDLSGAEDAKPGDEVVVLGRQQLEEITADDIADRIDSISYEVLCRLGNNNERDYIE